MAETTFELDNNTPYNITKVDGVWYFVTDLFNPPVGSGVSGQVGNRMPRSLRVVPQNLVPRATVTKDGKVYGYVPENLVKKHLASKEFRNAATLAGVSAYPSPGSPLDLNTIINNVNINVSRLNVDDRKQRYSVRAVSPETNESTLRTRQARAAGQIFDAKDTYSGINPIGNNSPWGILEITQQPNRTDSFGTDANSAGDRIVQRNELNYLVLADDKTGTITSKSSMSEDVFVQSIVSQSSADIRRDQEMLIKAGLLSPSATQLGVADTGYTTAMLDLARQVSFTNLSYYNSDKANLKPVTLNGYLNDLTKGFKERNTTTGTSTDLDVFSISKGDAAVLLEEFYAEAVGRRPNPKEVDAFRNAVNRAAKKDPTKTVTSRTTFTDMAGNQSSSSTSTNKEGFGVNDARMAGREQAEADPYSKGFLTSTKYFDVLVRSLRGELG